MDANCAVSALVICRDAVGNRSNFFHIVCQNPFRFPRRVCFISTLLNVVLLILILVVRVCFLKVSFFIYCNMGILYFAACKLDIWFNAVAEHKSVRKCPIPAGEAKECLKLDAYNVYITLSTVLLHRMLIVNVCGESQFLRFQFL